MRCGLSGHAHPCGPGRGIVALCPPCALRPDDMSTLGGARRRQSPERPAQPLAQGVAPALEGAAEGDLVGVFEVTADGQA